MAPGPLSITGYTNASTLSPTSSLTMTCETCGGVPAPFVQWVTSVDNTVIDQEAQRDLVTGCTSLTLAYSQVGQHLTNREVLTCKLDDGSDQTSRLLAIEGERLVILAGGALHVKL